MTTAAPYIVGGLLALILICLVLLALALAHTAKDPRISIDDEIRAGKDAEREENWTWPTEQHEVASFETEASPERIISTRRAA